MRRTPTALLAVSLTVQAALFDLQAQPHLQQSTVNNPTAQAPSAIPHEPSPEQLFARVVEVLRATADDAKRWDDARASAEVQSQIADLVWDIDPQEAQAYLVRAWETASRVKDEKRERSRFRNESSRDNARREVMLVARKRAPELAEKWLEQMAREAKEEQGEEPRGAFDDRTPRSAVLLQMAIQSADENPQAAASLATESLRDGISFGFQWALTKIQEKDFELAQTVFRSALTRLKTVGMVDPNELLILYAYLYTPGRIPAANTSENRGGSLLAVSRNQTRITAAAQLNPALALEFLRTATELLLSAPLPVTTRDPQTTARSQLSAINHLIDEVSRHLPEKAAALHARKQQIEVDARFTNNLPPPRDDVPTHLEGESREDYAERRVDVLEEAAKKEPNSLGRDIAYAKAALATTVEGYERGMSLAGKIQDEPLRDGISNWLTYRSSLHHIERKNLNKAYELLQKNGDPSQRAVCLVVGAQELLKSKDTNSARQWMQEASALIKKAETDGDWSRIAFGAVSTYGQFDKQMALELLSEAVRLLADSPTLMTDSDRAPSMKRFSGITPTLQDFTYGTTGFSLKAAVDAFTSSEFESLLPILNDIPSPETRGMAILTLCRKQLRHRSGSRTVSP